MKIIQLCEAVHYGDGVGNDIIRKAALLQELGYSCEIYAKQIDQCLIEQVRPIEKLVMRQGDILLHHYAGYSDMVEWIRDLPGIKVLIYHNITPPEMVKGETRAACELGIRQLSQLRGQYDYYVGDSAYNVSDMEKYNLAPSYDVLPIAIDLPVKNSKYLRQPGQRCSNGMKLLFVGRIARNKMQDKLLRVFDQYWNTYDQNARLTLVGDTGADPAYYQELCVLLDTLSSKHNIRLTGKVEDQDLCRIYEEADAYLSLSYHEGFGIPLLEAMQYEIPVFAFRSAAVEETLGGAGILLETDNPVRVSDILHEVMEDDVRCEEIILRQNERVKSFAPEGIKKKMQELITKWSTDTLKTIEEQAAYHRLSEAVSTAQSVQPQTESSAPVASEDRQDWGLDIERLRSLAANYAYRPLYSCRRYIGKLIVFGKRIVRKLLKWYLEPVCFQQTEFNFAIVDALQSIQQLQNEQMKSVRWVQEDQLQSMQQLREDQVQSIQQLREKVQSMLQFQEEQAQSIQRLQEEQAQSVQRLQEERVQSMLQFQEEQAQSIQQLRGEQMQSMQQFREEQAQIALRCSDVMQEDEYLSRQIQRMQNYLDRLDASGIPLFRPDQGVRWGDNKMSQDGTDTIVSTIVSLMGIPLDKVYYLDLGANHAIELSSTYFFYKNGARGVLVEANPKLLPELRILRSGDTVVGRAVVAESGGKIPFYVVPNGDGLSSIRESWVRDCMAQNAELNQIEEIQVDTITVNEIMESYCEREPVFINLDIEGTELEILRSFDFQKYRPLVFAVEMVPFRPNQLVLHEKNEEIVKLMGLNGYAEYAFTGVNSIFVDLNRLEAGK